LTLFVLDTGNHEVGFFTRYENYTLCTVGRRENSKEEAILGYNLRFFPFPLGNTSYSYTVEVIGKKCLAGVVFKDKGKNSVALVIYGKKGIDKVYIFSSKGSLMLWQVLKTKDGYLLTGGVKEKNWDAFLAYLDKGFRVVWEKRFDFSEEYFYSVAFEKERIYAVGRVKRKNNWDALVCIFSKDGKLLESYTLGSNYKDYFRFVKNLKGKVFAIGRSENKFGDSDFLVYDFKSYHLYDVSEYDYARVINFYGSGYIIAGETRFSGNNDGIFLILNKDLKPIKAFKLGWEETDAVRFMDKLIFTGYTYSLSFSADLWVGIFSEEFERVEVKSVRRKLEKREIKLKEVPFKLTRGLLQLLSFRVL